MRKQFAHAVDQFFQGESGGSRAGRKLTGHLTKLALTFGRFLFDLFVADKGPGALVCLQHAAEFELAISPHHGIRIDGEIDRELPDSRQLISGGQCARSDSCAHLIDQLAIDRDPGMQVERESEGRTGLSAVSHVSQCTIELVQYVKSFLGAPNLVVRTHYMVKDWANPVSDV